VYSVASDRLSIVQVITPHRFAGAEHVCAHLAQELSARGHRVHLVAPPRLQLFQEYVASLGVPFIPLKINGKLNQRAPHLLASLAREVRADLFHAHLSTANYHAGRARKLAKVPLVSHVHAMSSPLWYRAADLVLTCTYGVARHLQAAGLNHAPIEVVYNGILPEEFSNVRSPEEVRSELHLPATVPVVGVVASLTKRKGHAYLLEALSLLRDKWPDLMCLILGEGPLRRVLEQRTQVLGLNDRVRFLGFREDRLDFMQIFDILVLPSVGVEGFGLSIIEAAMFGVPSVASNLPGVDEAVVNGETGVLVPPRDAHALAEAIDRLLSDETERRRLGRHARRRARTEFTISSMADGVEQAYRRMLATVRL
jgi:glycosyltransferase involved in cell wall biosynthesis